MPISDELKLPRGVELAQGKAQAASVRNVKRVDTVDISWLEAMIAEDGDDGAELPPEPSRVSKLPPFVLDGAHFQVRTAYGAVMDFVDGARGDKPARPHWLSLLGGCGCGKTHLAKLAHAMLADAGVAVQFWTWRDVLDRLRYGDGGLLRRLGEARAVVLDDIGAEFSATEKSLDFSMSALNELQDLRAGRWTLLTSNLRLEDFGMVQDRVASRLLRYGGEVVMLDEASDWSVMHAKARGAVK